MIHKKNREESIKKQMERILIFMGILFVCLMLVINYSMQQILLVNVQEHTDITAQKLRNQLDFLYDKMETFCMSIAGGEELQQIMTVPFSEKAQVIRPMDELIAYYKIMEPGIVDIALVNEEMHASSIYTYEQLDRMREQSMGNQFSWLGVGKSDFISQRNMRPVLQYGHEVMVNGENVGTLIISIDYSYFQMSGNGEVDSYYLLADADGVLLSFNGSQETAQRIWEQWKKELQGDIKPFGGKQDLVVQSFYSDKMGCYQISAMDTRQVIQSVGTLQKLVWLCLALMLLFMMVFFWLINMRMVKPLQYFHGIMREIRSAGLRNLKEKLNLGGCREIKEIGEEFCGMLTDIEELNCKIFDTATGLYEMKVQKQEAELSYMRSQIDPHFLYNTLEVFRKMALEKNAADLAQMAVDMGQIFRYSTKGGSIVPLKDEIEIIQSYIRIQKNRFQGKIEVFYFLPKETLEVPVMKMLLQPIVENAIYHGLEPKEDKGNLYVGARIEERILVITIKDDGVGIEPDNLELIKQELEQEHYDTSRHVGLLNTQARIRLLYGTDFGITVESRPGDGTTVTMRVPANDTEGRE